jgi:hypothetical protein
MIHTENGNIKAPPYLGWEQFREKPGISTFAKPLFTNGYVWRLNLQSSPEDVYVVHDAVYRYNSPSTGFVDHWSWLPKTDMLVSAFAKILDANQKCVSIEESDAPNTWVRLPKNAMLPKSTLEPVPDRTWMGNTHAEIAQALFNKIEGMERRAKELSESSEPDEMLFLDEDVFVLKQYYTSFLSDCIQMYTSHVPHVVYPIHNKRPGQVQVRFYSTTARIARIPLSSVVLNVVREHIEQLETRLRDENDIDSMLDIEDMVRALHIVVHDGFVALR